MHVHVHAGFVFIQGERSAVVSNSNILADGKNVNEVWVTEISNVEALSVI